MKALRDERYVMRPRVARQFGVHYNTIKNWELGNAWPGPKELLAKVYDIEPEDFYIGVSMPGNKS